MPRSVRLPRESRAPAAQLRTAGRSAAAALTDLSPRGARFQALAQLMRHDRGCGCPGCGARALIPAAPVVEAKPLVQAKPVAQLCPLCDDPSCLNGEKCGRKDKHAHFAAPQGPKNTKTISKEEADLNAFIKQGLLASGLGKKKEAVPGTPENSPPPSPKRGDKSEKTDE